MLFLIVLLIIVLIVVSVLYVVAGVLAIALLVGFVIASIVGLIRLIKALIQDDEDEFRKMHGWVGLVGGTIGWLPVIIAGYGAAAFRDPDFEVNFLVVGILYITSLIIAGIFTRLCDVMRKRVGEPARNYIVGFILVSVIGSVVLAFLILKGIIM